MVLKDNFEKILNATFEFIKKSNYHLQACIYFLTCILVKGDRLDYDKNEDLEFDEITLKVMYKRIKKKP